MNDMLPPDIADVRGIFGLVMDAGVGAGVDAGMDAGVDAGMDT